MSAALLDLFPKGTGAVIARTFECMEIAGRLVEESLRGTRGKVKARVDACFGLLCPPEVLRRLPASVYEHHAREIIERAKDPKGRASLATKAEVLAHLSLGSLRHPLERGHQALFEELFQDVVGELPGTPEERTRGSWPTETRELLLQYREKFRTHGREFPA